jgi:hypothetical protein
MNERRPGAGTNGWNAAVRMRWWLEIVRDNGDATNDRKLHRMKVTGAYNDRRPVDLVVGEGGWLEPARKENAGETAFGAEQRLEQGFLDFVAKRARQGRPLSPAKNAGNYGPKEFVKETKGAKIRSVELLMDYLLEDTRLEIMTDGPPSKRIKMLVVAKKTSIPA